MKKLIGEVDLFHIFNTIRKLDGTNDDFWEETPCGKFDVHYTTIDADNVDYPFTVYPCLNGETDTSQWLLPDDFDEDALDDAYRNSLTCSECGCEHAFCTCTTTS